MKTKTTVIDFLNLAELATQCFFAALNNLQKSLEQEVDNYQDKIKKYLLDHHPNLVVAVCVTCQKADLSQVMQTLSVEKCIQDLKYPDRFAVVIDRVLVSSQKMNRLDQAIQYAQKFKFTPSFYTHSEDNSNNNWAIVDIPICNNENNDSASNIVKSFHGLSWDDVFLRFSKPNRFNQFQAAVGKIFGFQLADKTTLRSFIYNCKNYYSESTNQIQQLLQFCDDFEDLAQLIVDADINKLPRKLLNLLVALKAYMLTRFEDTFVIDGPIPRSAFEKIKKNIDIGKVKHINCHCITLSWENLPKAQNDNLSWAITIPDSAFCFGTIGQFFGISEELARFYISINKSDYRGKSLQTILDGKVLEFIDTFANHPRFRGFAGIWRKMNLPNYSLSQKLEALSYPEALLVTIVKSASRIRENSIIIPPIEIEGINSEQASLHLKPLIEWCEHHRCYVYLET